MGSNVRRWGRGAAAAVAVLIGLAGCSSGSERPATAGGAAQAGSGSGSGSGSHSPKPRSPGVAPGDRAGGAAAPAPGSGYGDYGPDEPTPTEGPAEGPTRTSVDPVSTIALDVDTASYGFTQRQLRDGVWPQPGTVRAEEFVNALRQDYPDPAGDGFSISIDGGRTPVQAEGSAGHVLRVGLRTRGRDQADRPDAALTFVIDVSGSMGEPGRLDLAKDALHTLVRQLRSSDRVAIVAFSDTARVVQSMTPVRERADLDAAIEDLHTESSTNLEAGLVLGYRVARDGFRAGASNRVVLLSDALANVGNTSAEPILRQVREQAGKGIALLGVGVGSQYGDTLMERLADSGDGFAVYVSEPEQARRVFVEQLPATIEVRALDAKAQVRFDPRVVESYRLIGYADRAVADGDFKDDTVDGGEVGPGHTVTALYDIRLRPDAEGRIGTVEVHWVNPGERSPADARRDIQLSDVDRSGPATSRWLRADVVAARLAEALRSNDRSALPGIAAAAAAAARELDDATVRDLADTARRAAQLR
ncbi:MAG TPA: von Willebrand factor type A domain-containing protein [Mycobacteriales bacterium]|nr:von Willebrand factor type A domain-containing protein [Mycobacteriales bacterium]